MSRTAPSSPPDVHFGLTDWLLLVDVVVAIAFVAVVWTRNRRRPTTAPGPAPSEAVQLAAWFPPLVLTLASMYSSFKWLDGDGFVAATPAVVLALPAVLSWKRWRSHRRTSGGSRRATTASAQPLRGYLAVISLSFVIGAAVMAYGFVPTPMGFGWLALTIVLAMRFARRWRGPRTR